MPKLPIATDERSLGIVNKICTRLYFGTMGMLSIAVLFRAIVLKQGIPEYEDMAAIVTANVILFTVSMLYTGGFRLNVKKVPPKKALIFYLGFVTIGSVVTILKYGIWDISFILGKLAIIATICAIFVIGWIAVAYFGNRKIEKEIDED
jgi:Family of unknown function (DUF6773)